MMTQVLFTKEQMHRIYYKDRYRIADLLEVKLNLFESMGYVAKFTWHMYE